MSGMTLGGWVGADRRMREFEGRVRRERRMVEGVGRRNGG